ncbi:unnamed protein product, partial [Oppiella nova]
MNTFIIIKRIAYDYSYGSETFHTCVWKGSGKGYQVLTETDYEFDTDSDSSHYELVNSSSSTTEDPTTIISDDPISSSTTELHTKSVVSTPITTESVAVTMTSTLPPPSTTPEITISVPLCNIDGRYDGQYGIEHWPPVPIGRRSRVKCPHEDSGHAYWKCMQNGLFSSHGPNWTHCDYWLEELDKTDIDSVDTAIDVIETITKKTYNNNTIVESEKLSKVLDIVSKVQSFVENANDSSLVVVKNYTHGVINTFSHILDQKYAWINSTSKEKTNLASKILLTT